MMRSKLRSVFPLVLLLLMALTGCEKDNRKSPGTGWPEITREMKPWSRWWWMASAADTANLTAAMEQYASAGLGGLEITPIYGVHGYEDRFVKFLSPQWVDLLEYALREAGRLDLGIDVSMASGWPFGGPWVTPEDACRTMSFVTSTQQGGSTVTSRIFRTQEPLLRVITRKELKIEQLKDPISANADSLQAWAIDQVRFPRPMPLKVLMAYSNMGEVLDLTPLVSDEGLLTWEAPPGEWKLVALFEGWHGKMVERAGPGGEGDVIDHFSATATDNYLTHFDKAFEGRRIDGLRAWFNDSYEVDDARGEADFTPLLFEEFEKRRGYDLRHYLPALLGLDSAGVNSRVLTDYRETLSDLILENYTRRWHNWARDNGKIIRNQAHGAPAHILDLYASADIPETEGEDIVKVKSASSVAHVTGKKLASSESATWLKDHFEASLEDVKHAVDLFLLAGINHIFYHGTTYSPQDAPWPGWMFYAAVHFGPTNPIWNDFPVLNGYIARSQSFLQAGKPDNDILLYYPIYDEYAVRGRSLLLHFDGSAGGSSLRPVALQLWNQGYAFDYISDRQIQNLEVHNGSLLSGGNSFKTIMIPHTRLMPVETFEKIITLALEGATILMAQLPEDVPGLGNLANRQEKLLRARESLAFEPFSDGMMKASVGKGMILTGNPELLPAAAEIPAEPMTSRGLRCIRRTEGKVTTWFIANRGESEINGMIPLSKKGSSAVLYNPMTGIHGRAHISSSATGTEVLLRLVPGESCLVRLFPGKVDLPGYPYTEAAGEKTAFNNIWKLHFTEGGPLLPPDQELTHPILWSDLDGEAFRAFSGSATYSTTFSRPVVPAGYYRLSPGELFHSARISLNGKELATLIAPPFYVDIPAEEFKNENILEIRVSNLMGNRIADMERKGIPYKIFYNVNFPAYLAHNRGADGLFTTLGWQTRPSGLAGPVTLQPIKQVSFPSP